MCSIPDIHGALEEMRRVLKPARSAALRDTRAGLGPQRAEMAESSLSALDSREPRLPSQPADRDSRYRAAFEVNRLQTGYMTGPKPMTFMYEGVARPH